VFGQQYMPHMAEQANCQHVWAHVNQDGIALVAEGAFHEVVVGEKASALPCMCFHSSARHMWLHMYACMLCCR